MAKMFYTLEEAAAKLGVSEDEIRSMVGSGQLQEFRDRDNLMFKVEQVDLLAGGGDEEEDVIQLADSGAMDPISLEPGASGSGSGPGDLAAGLSGSGPALAGSGSGLDLDDPGGTGISIFESDEDDAAAQTQITDSPALGGSGFGFDAGASGSGLMDLTQEADDTSLGADFLADLDTDSGDDDIGETVASDEDASALFESSGAESDVSGPAAMAAPAMMLEEVYDGPGSGLVGGAALGLALTCVVSIGVLTLGVLSSLGEGGSIGLLNTIGSSLWIVVGAAGGITLLCAGVGFFLGKRG